MTVEGRAIDLVTARRETYSAPGALPEVMPASLAEDLGRRDFTVNAMAIGIRGPGRRKLADPHGGRADLTGRLIRRLRPGEFREDPSRVVRAARYATRLGFSLEPATAAEIRETAPALALGSARVAEEVRRLVDEESAAAGFRLLADLGVVWARAVADERLARLASAAALPGAPDVDVASLWLGAAILPDALAGAALAGWSRAQAESVGAGPELAARLRGAPLSVVDRAASRVSAAAQVAAAAEGSEEIATWWRRGRDARLEISGSDLVAAGCSPGPALGRGLAAARAAALDGEAPDRESQLRVALAAASEP